MKKEFVFLISSIFAVLIIATILITATGKDINGDGVVNRTDIAILASIYRQSNATFDQNGDGTINLLDLVIVSKNISNGTSNSSWPDNEPSSMTQIAYSNGSDKNFSITPTFTNSEWLNNSRVEANVVDTDSRYGTVVQKRQFIGDPSDWNGILTCNGCSAWTTDYKEVYFRWIVKYSSNYDVHASGEKHFYWGNGGTGSADDYYILMQSNREIGVHNQAPSAGFSQVLSGDIMSLDQFVTFEMRIRHETNVSANDGILTLWMDGNVIYNATNVNWTTAGDADFQGFQVYEYWGGSGDTKAANDVISISEFKVSGKN